jgi:hypothetical protein
MREVLYPITIHNLLCHNVRLSDCSANAVISSSFWSCLDGGELLLGMAFDDCQHLILFHDEVLLVIQRDFLARILAEQNPVARFDV